LFSSSILFSFLNAIILILKSFAPLFGFLFHFDLGLTLKGAYWSTPEVEPAFFKFLREKHFWFTFVSARLRREVDVQSFEKFYVERVLEPQQKFDFHEDIEKIKVQKSVLRVGTSELR
jgi:hypothetical protein